MIQVTESASAADSRTPCTHNVLVFPGGTEIGLEIHRSLRDCKEIELFSAGAPVSNHAPFVYARHAVVPGIDDPGWIDALNQVIREYDIDYIYPAYDDVIVALAHHSHRIHARIVSSPAETCIVTRSKSQTYHALAGAVAVPRLYVSLDAIDAFPVFVKPDRGQGSQRTHVAHTRDHVSELLRQSDDYLVLEYLPGAEFTIDCFSDRDAGLLFCAARQRVRIKSGISMNTRPAHSETFTRCAHAIASRLALHGAWFFQVKQNRDGGYSLLEVAPRVAGGMSLHRVLGINFPLLSIHEQERIPVQILLNGIHVELDRALVNRYSHNLRYSTVYVDLDDTLLCKGRVNVEVVRFLYQALNGTHRLVLLTRHAGDLDATLRHFRLQGLFDQIIHVRGPEGKHLYIREPDAILIDDSFRERKAARDKLGIATFDCSMLEMLQDERS
jgi:hypothetical protein